MAELRLQGQQNAWLVIEPGRDGFLDVKVADADGTPLLTEQAYFRDVVRFLQDLTRDLS